jgi:cardiolipin synthase
MSDEPGAVGDSQEALRDQGVQETPDAGEASEASSPRRPRWRRVTGVLSVAVVFHLIGAFSSVDAVMSTRTPQGAIAWGIALNTMPYVAVPAYWIFGRSRFEGYVDSRRASEGEMADLATRIREPIEPYMVPAEVMDTAPAGRAAERLAGLPYLTGNATELLIDGEETFASILEGIGRAQDYILFQFFIVKDDELGREVQAHLIRKAREGVRVYFLYDEVGSHSLSSGYVRELRDAGVRILEFNTRKGPRNRFQLNFRNHRKVVVVDGKAAWIGGHNVGDEYMGRDPRFGRWRDTHMKIEGPAVMSVQLSFVEDWAWAADEILDVNWIPTPAEGQDRPVLILPSGPADDLETAALMFIHAINTAKERIWIASPYFVPDDGVMAALQLAGLRGVDVRILIPDEPDHLAVYLAAFTYVEEAAKTGVRLFRYTDGFLHQKVMVIDHRSSTIGTANFDNRSFRLNFEITGVVTDTTFTREVAEMLEEDFARSTPMPGDALSKKPFWFRLAARIARLSAPVQ